MALIGILLCLAVISSQGQQPSGDTNQAEATPRNADDADEGEACKAVSASTHSVLLGVITIIYTTTWYSITTPW